MGMPSCLCPLVLDSTHAVLPKTLRRARTLPSSQPPALVASAQLGEGGGEGGRGNLRVALLTICCVVNLGKNIKL